MGVVLQQPVKKPVRGNVVYVSGAVVIPDGWYVSINGEIDTGSGWSVSVDVGTGRRRFRINHPLDTAEYMPVVQLAMDGFSQSNDFYRLYAPLVTEATDEYFDVSVAPSAAFPTDGTLSLMFTVI